MPWNDTYWDLTTICLIKIIGHLPYSIPQSIPYETFWFPNTQIWFVFSILLQNIWFRKWVSLKARVTSSELICTYWVILIGKSQYFEMIFLFWSPLGEVELSIKIFIPYIASGTYKTPVHPEHWSYLCFYLRPYAILGSLLYLALMWLKV